MNLNKTFIIGNLTRDPELKTLPSGTSVASFGIATNRVWKNDKGEKQEEVQFHNIVVFGRQAETVSQYLKKGSLALVEGRIQTQSWTAPDGAKRSRTEIVAERIQFGPRGASKDAAPSSHQKDMKDMPVIDLDTEGEIKSEDLPF